MANPLYGAMGGSRQPMNMIQAFQQFMQQNQGKNPNEMIQQALSSGKISQQQLNQVQQMAQQVQAQLNGLKSMFGFK